jgi:hypothetical protein
MTAGIGELGNKQQLLPVAHSLLLQTPSKESPPIHDTYVLQGAVMAVHPVDVQYSDIVPYMRLICSKKEIAANKQRRELTF